MLALALSALVACLPAHAGPEATRLPGWSAWRWTSEDGLPLDAVTGLAFDGDGLAWIGTFDGVARFDGHRFEVFRPATHPGLPTARITAVAAGPDGAPWLLTEASDVVRWTGQGFERQDSEPWGIGPIGALIPGGAALWVQGHRGMARVDAAGVSAVPWAALPDTDRLRSAHPSPEGLLISSRAGRVLDVDPQTGEGRVLGGVERLDMPTGPVRWHAERPARAVRTATGMAAVRGGRLTLDGPDEEPRILAYPGTNARVFVAPSGALRLRSTAGDFELRDGALVPTAAGLGVAEDTWWAWEARLYRGDTLVLEGRSSLGLLAEDGDGGVWLTDDGHGLLHVRRSPVTSLMEDEHGPIGQVDAVLFDRDGALWMAGERLRRRKDGRSDLVVDATGAPVLAAMSLLATQDGQVWVTLSDGACRIAEPAAPGSPVCIDPEPGRSRRNYAVQLQTRDGRTWGGADDVVRLEPDGTRSLFGQTEGWRPIREMLELADGTVLASGIGAGLVHVDGDAEARRTEEPGSPIRTVRAMVQDERGDVWLGTEGNGLCRLELSAGGGVAGAPLRCLGPPDGLADPFVSSLTSDGQGRLWMSSNRGLSAVDWGALLDTIEGRRARVPTRVLGRREGMLEPETNGMHKPSAAVAPDGAIWYPTMAGVARLDPAAVVFPPPPRVAVVGLSTPDAAWTRPPDALTLDEDARELRVSWTAPAFDHVDALRFRYRLAGLDTEWRGPTQDRAATWTTLPPGSYTLELQAGWAGDVQGGEPVWGAAQAITRVDVPPTFRETPWFWLLLAASGAGFAGLLVWGRLRQSRLRAEQLQRAVDAATVELATRNRRLVAQSTELTAQRQALAEQASELEERNARIAAQAATLAERNERVAAQAERLEQLDQVRTRFVANISHELRTPLTLIRGTLEDALPQAPERLARPLDVASRNAERLGELVEQLLDVARLDAGGVPLRARRGDLGQWVARIAGRFAPAAASRGVALRVEVPEAVPAWFDPDLLEKVLTNLLANGLDHCPAGGWLAVSLATRGDDAVGAAEIRVVDTGPGIPEHLRERLFERFFQADDSDRRARGGAGIGLALAREIVALHGGEIDATNTPDAGACFTVRLPLGAAHLGVDEVVLVAPEAPAPAAEWAPRLDGDAAPVVLLVEDHPDMRAWMAEHLSTVFQVAQAEDGAAALARLEAGLEPALVVSDVMMPNLDGLGLCRALRADPRWAGLPVLLVTAKATEADRVAGLEVASDYLTKPFRTADLLAKARQLARVPDVPAPAPTAPSAFVEKLEAVALEHLDDTGFGAAVLAKRFGLSQRQLQRRLREETGRTPAAWLRELRLQRARELLQGGEVETVGEAAAQVGMSRSYLSRLYAQWAGRAASEELSR